MVRLMRHGGGFGAVIVAGQTEHAAVFGRARRIAMAEDVAAAVDAGALAVPDADHAIVPGAGRQIELLRAPDRGGREVLVHAGLELDVVLFEVFSRGEQLLVVAAERRTAITGDEARGIEARGAVAADLRHRQPNQRLDSGQEDVAGPLGVFLIETDRTLVDSHSTLFKPVRRLGRRLFLASHLNSLEPVYVGFCGRAHHKSRQWRPAISRSQFRAWNTAAFDFGLCRSGARRRNDVARSFPLVLRYSALRGTDRCRHDIATMRAILADPVFVHCVRLPGARAGSSSPSRRDHRARQGAGRSRRLRELPYRRSRKTVRRRQTDRHPVRRDLFAQSDAGSRYRPRRLERRGFLPRAARRRSARRLALLPGVSLSVFHQTHPRRHSGDPRLSRDADAGPQRRAAAATALAAELSRRDAGLELAVLPARHFRARPAKERGMESRRAIWSRARRIAAPATRPRTCSAPTGAASALAAAWCRAGLRRGSTTPRAAD